MVGKRLTTNEFIARAQALHGNKYDYSRVEYVNMRTKVCIVCPTHGEFWQSPIDHLNTGGCNQCGISKRAKKKTQTTETFIKRAKEVHGDRYDYSKVDYKRCNRKVCIICPIHGEFYQMALDHLDGAGCPLCANERKGKHKRITQEQFIERAKEKHGDTYDYSLVQYRKNTIKVKLLCREHGEFLMTPQAHLAGQGCPICGRLRAKTKISSNTEEFVRKATLVHKGRYDYSKVNYAGKENKVVIICPIHGEFVQSPHSHLNGCGCSKCATEESRKRQTMSLQEFVARAQEKHRNAYDYSKSVYVNSHTPIVVSCPKHGEFSILPYVHLQGTGCPSCYCVTSRGEDSVAEYVTQLGFAPQRNIRRFICGKEIDIFIKEKNVAIEYNGLYWHSEANIPAQDYHLRKTMECEERGVHLLHIFEDEWIQRRTIVQQFISMALGVSEKYCSDEERNIAIGITDSVAMNFMEEYSIIGFVRSDRYIGGYINNALALCVSFSKNGVKNEWTLTNYAYIGNCDYSSLWRKAFSCFLSVVKPDAVTAIADRRWYSALCENIFTQMGFVFEKTLDIDYEYIKNNRTERYSKMLVERTKNDTKHPYLKIWNCGYLLYRYVTQKIR